MKPPDLEYKGYVGRMKIDTDADIIHGDVVGILDVITFEGQSVEEAKQAFRDSVDDYLEFCESLGDPPEKPFSGTFLVRVKPDLHRDLASLARRRGESVNALVTRALAKVVKNARKRLATPRVEKPKVAKPKATKPAKRTVQAGKAARKKVEKTAGRKSKASRATQ
jgi:predicted HicB family RNase H-like nuclease